MSSSGVITKTAKWHSVTACSNDSIVVFERPKIWGQGTGIATYSRLAPIACAIFRPSTDEPMKTLGREPASAAFFGAGFFGAAFL